MKDLMINKKYKINKNVMSQSGMLYKGATIRVLEMKEESEAKRIMIEDMIGRIFHVDEQDITQ